MLELYYYFRKLFWCWNKFKKNGGPKNSPGVQLLLIGGGYKYWNYITIFVNSFGPGIN